VDICNSYNGIKGLASLIQLGYAIVTLYRSRGDQIEQYGYAAFGLTVVQYAVVSVVNLLANILTPDYPALYMVRSEVMKEAEGRGGKFDGTIGEINVADGQQDGGKMMYNLCLDMDVSEASLTANPAGITEDKKLDSSMDPKTVEEIRVDSHPKAAKRFERITSSVLKGYGAFLVRENEKTPLTISTSVRFNDPGDLVHDPAIESEGVLVVPAAGRLVRQKTAPPRLVRVFWYCAVLAGIFAVIVPWAVIGGFTGFKKGHSTKAQRSWTTSWLVLGQFCGFTLVTIVSQLKSDIARREGGKPKYEVGGKYSDVLYVVVGALTYGVACIGGLVVVAQMILEFGSCVLV
jgi:hypothetical protein